MEVELRWDRHFALEQVGGDERILNQLLALAKESMSNKARELEEAFRGRDAGGVAEAAHALKGSASNIGLLSVQETAHAIEIIAAGGEVSSLEQEVKKLVGLVELFVASPAISNEEAL